MRIRDWYFHGWERATDENGKSRLVYTGEYYSFTGGVHKAKAVCVGLMAALWALYLIAAGFPGEGGMWRCAAIPQLLELIPLIYLFMGAFNLLRTTEPMTFRDYYASWRRMERASLWSTGFTVLMAAAEIVYLFRFRLDASMARELLYLLEVAGCAALSLALFLFIKKHPCRQSAGQGE